MTPSRAAPCQSKQRLRGSQCRASTSQPLRHQVASHPFHPHDQTNDAQRALGRCLNLRGAWTFPRAVLVLRWHDGRLVVRLVDPTELKRYDRDMF